MMVQYKIEADGVIKGLMNMQQAIDPETELALNTAASFAQIKMSQEAPIATGRLRESIKIKSSKFRREIEPTAQNLGGHKYGLFVEKGTGPAGGNAPYVPNVFSIMQHYGVSKKIAWAIAMSIKQKGTPVNPFVERAFDWVEPRLKTILGDLAKRITMWYERGA